MTMIRKLPLLLLFGLFAGTLLAQSTIIEYDFQTETYEYFKIDENGIRKKIKSPFGYKKVPTKIVIKDFNTFNYDVNFEVESHMEEPIGGDQDMATLKENFTMGASAFQDMIQEVKENDIYKKLWVDGKFQGLTALKGGSGFSESDFMDEIELMGKKVQIIEETLGKIDATVGKMRESFVEIMLVEFVNDQYKDLVSNYKLSAEEMRARSKELSDKIFGEEVSLERVIKLSDVFAEKLNKNYTDFKSNYGLYSTLHDDFIGYLRSLEDDTDEEFYQTTVMSVLLSIENKYKETAMLDEVLDYYITKYDIQQLRNNYLTTFKYFDNIQHADFEVSYSVNNALDVTTVKLNFVEKSMDSVSSEQTIRVREIHIPTKGGLRINSSAGMSFIRYLNGNKSYSSLNGVIEEVQGDAFIPSLTTMFHFYRQTPAPVALGGSIGFGVPIEGNKDFLYMLGGSVIFGKTQRVILNLGALGGKTEVLSGAKVGDAITPGGALPTKEVFDFGVYLGLTLNIAQFM